MSVQNRTGTECGAIAHQHAGHVTGTKEKIANVTVDDGETDTSSFKASLLIDRLRRKTSSGTYLPEIDGLRFLSILGVIIVHVYVSMMTRNAPKPVSILYNSGGQLGNFLQQGFWGVQLFFVISGFILALPFAAHRLMGEKSISLKSYFLRRISRLEPPFIVSTLCFSILFVAEFGINGSTIKHTIATLLYSHGLLYQSKSLISVITWSLEVEIQFYLIMPLLAYIFCVRSHLIRSFVFLSLILCFVLIDISTRDHWTWGSLTIVVQLPFFLVGMMGADYYCRNKNAERSTQWDMVALVCISISLFLTLTRSVALVWCLPFAFMGVLLSALYGVYWRRLLSVSIVSIIGGMCYSIYLWHAHVIGWTLSLTDSIDLGPSLLANFTFQFVVCLIPILLISSIAYILIERPCMERDWWPKLLAKFKNRLRAA